jgi:dTDP-4-amino-4,6-dideoxygalactose transaminase
MEIGGEFCFADMGRAPEGEASVADLLDGWSRRYPTVFLSSGRSAYLNAWLNLLHTVRDLDTVLLPSYLCYSILMPFRRMAVRIEYYRVDADLAVDWEDLESKAGRLGSRAVAVIVNYFGFPESGDVVRAICRIRQTGARVVFDATHSLLNDCPWPAVADSSGAGPAPGSTPGSAPAADVCIMSLRKALPVVDGAVVVWLDGARPAPALSVARERVDSYFSSRALAMIMKASYIVDGWGDRRDYLNLYDQAEAALDREFGANRGMSSVSRSIVKRLGVDRIRRARRENYTELVRALHEQDAIHAGLQLLFPKLPDGVVPLGCPVVTDERDVLREYLAARGILTQILWQSPPEVPREEFPESWRLSERILVLPCDQRYSVEHMEVVARAAVRRDSSLDSL